MLLNQPCKNESGFFHGELTQTLNYKTQFPTQTLYTVISGKKHQNQTLTQVDVSVNNEQGTWYVTYMMFSLHKVIKFSYVASGCSVKVKIVFHICLRQCSMNKLLNLQYSLIVQEKIFSNQKCTEQSKSAKILKICLYNGSTIK